MWERVKKVTQSWLGLAFIFSSRRSHISQPQSRDPCQFNFGNGSKTSPEKSIAPPKTELVSKMALDDLEGEFFPFGAILVISCKVISMEVISKAKGTMK